MGELVTEAARPRTQAGRPPHDARAGHPAFVDLALPAPERGVAGHGPAPRVVVVGRRPAQLADAGPQLLGPGRVDVHQPDVVDRAHRPALGAGPVVRHHHDQGPPQVARLGQEAEDPGQLVVGVGQVGGEALHEPGRHRLVGRVHGVPRRDPGRPLGQRGARVEEAQGLLAGEGLVSPGVPPGVEAAPVAGDPLGRGVVGRVAGPRGPVQEERPLPVDRPQVGHELPGPVGQVGAQVVAVLGGGRRDHGVAVVVEGGHELVGLAPVEPVPPVEAPGQRPGGPGRPEPALVVGGQVPFADGVGRVAPVPEHLGQKAVLGRDAAPVARVPHGQVGHPAHAVAVVVAPGQQARPGGRAQGGGVEVGQPDAAGGQPVDRRGVEVGPVAAELAEADVVQHDDHDVGGAGGGGGLGRPPRLRVAPVVPDDPREVGPGASRRHADTLGSPPGPPVVDPSPTGSPHYARHGRPRARPGPTATTQTGRGHGLRPGHPRRHRGRRLGDRAVPTPTWP